MSGTTDLGSCTDAERAVLDNAASDLAKGRMLRRWFMDAWDADCFAERFKMTSTDRDDEQSMGFFGVADLPGGVRMPVMGNAQKMFFDRPRTGGEGALEFARQLQEFVFRYFLRVASFQQPEAVDRATQAGTDRGFGYTQHFAKCRTGRIVRFSNPYRILDLRDLASAYDWVVARIHFHDFDMGVQLGSEGAPTLTFRLEPENYIVLSPEFIVQRERYEPGVLVEYGFAYAAIHNPNPGLLAYGPGAFEAAVQLFHWRVFENGSAEARMAFVSNRPQQIARIPIDPVHWALSTADLASLRFFSKELGEFRQMWKKVAKPGIFDPVYGAIDGLNFLTNEKAARDWNVSRQQMEKNLLMLHFRQHYRAICGALRTWRQVADWTNESTMPQWAIEGNMDPLANGNL